MTRAPTLDRRLILEEATAVSDGAGGFSEVWNSLGAHWAEVAARTGSGRPGEFRTSGRLGLKITVRFAPQGSAARPKPGQRFVDGDRIYSIEAVHEDGARGSFLMCFSEEELRL